MEYGVHSQLLDSEGRRHRTGFDFHRPGNLPSFAVEGSRIAGLIAGGRRPPDLHGAVTGAFPPDLLSALQNCGWSARGRSGRGCAADRNSRTDDEGRNLLEPDRNSEERFDELPDIRTLGSRALGRNHGAHPPRLRHQSPARPANGAEELQSQRRDGAGIPAFRWSFEHDEQATREPAPPPSATHPENRLVAADGAGGGSRFREQPAHLRPGQGIGRRKRGSGGAAGRGAEQGEDRDCDQPGKRGAPAFPGRGIVFFRRK